LYFAASEGFPMDKAPGQPCCNLTDDFRCSVHQKLIVSGLKGCFAFDCFGAGQKVSQNCFAGRNWKEDPDLAEPMFKIFLIMRQLHELLWYLHEAAALQPARHMQADLNSMFIETERLTYLSSASLLELDVSDQRAKVDRLLSQASSLVRTSFGSKLKSTVRHGLKFKPGADLIGADLKETSLIGANLRGACLIAADLSGAVLSGTDFIGADFRDADLKGADLSQSIFLTQAQINSAKGDVNTKLPSLLIQPAHWLYCEGVGSAFKN
jgi:hypothetical protein